VAIPSQAVTIRAYAPADLDTLIALYHDTIHRVAARDYDAEQIAAWAPDQPDRATLLRTPRLPGACRAGRALRGQVLRNFRMAKRLG
jgi:hypothetical protein